jgi:serine/threonine protein kinase
LIHRDLKPSNIMLTSDSEVKVIDFGLAKAITDATGDMDLTHGEFVGTPTFASPEQFGGGPVDARSDIYALGGTLWFALTGLPPHPGKTLEEIRDRKKRDGLPVAQLIARKVPDPLVKLLRSTLAIDPAKRPASARELMEALESCRRNLRRRIGASSEETALRNEAFARALTEAKACASDPESLRALFDSAAKKASKRETKLANENTFEVVAREWIGNQRHRLAPRYLALLLARLEADIFPHIGSRPIAEVDAPELLDTLKVVEKRGVVIQDLKTVPDYAKFVKSPQHAQWLKWYAERQK